MVRLQRLVSLMPVGDSRSRTEQMVDSNEHNANHIALLALAGCKLEDGNSSVEVGQVSRDCPEVSVCVSRKHSQIVDGLQFRVWQVLAVNETLQIVLNILSRASVL